MSDLRFVREPRRQGIATHRVVDERAFRASAKRGRNHESASRWGIEGEAALSLSKACQKLAEVYREPPGPRSAFHFVNVRDTETDESRSGE